MDSHRSEQPGAMEAKNGHMEANNGAMKANNGAMEANKEPWRLENGAVRFLMWSSGVMGQFVDQWLKLRITMMRNPYLDSH